MFQTPQKSRQAKRLRSEMTSAEAKLWALLRNRGFAGFKFRHQTPVAGAVADFFCSDLKLVVELDGGVHRLREDEDTARDQRLAEAGVTVLRVGNEAFLRNPNGVLDAIREHAASVRTQPPHPTGSAGHLLPRGEKG